MKLSFNWFNLILLFPCFYFFYWIDNADRNSKIFPILYYFYWIYLSLLALLSMDMTIFSFLFFPFVLNHESDASAWGVGLLLIVLSLGSDWLDYIFFKKMLRLRKELGKSTGGRYWFISVFIYRRWLMAHLKSFITRYSKVYIGLVLLIWIAFFFLPWGSPILGGKIDLFSIQKVLLVFGILSILMALLSKKVSLFVFGLICCLSLWINLFILFAILPIFGN